MVLWIGVDDTDSLEGMCTTFLATELVRDLTEDYDLIGYPRLVRLNPNIPWKTRGNGAICLRFGRGVGGRTVVGEIHDRPIWAFARARGRDEPTRVLDRVERLVERRSELRDPTTNPGFCILPEPPAAGLYWKAVRRVVTKDEAMRAVRTPGVLREYKNGRGIIGALAATSWRPRDRTYEVLGYREANRWGTTRVIDPESVQEMDRAFPSTFNNFDYACNHVVIAPHSPCPVLLGIRGDDPTVLPAAMRTIRGEALASWVIFETNQGTDDHVGRSRRMEPQTTVRVDRRITAMPRVIPGGHVIVHMGDLDAAAYEPSKGFRGAIRALRPGDYVRVVGSVRDEPRTLNIEKLEVLYLADDRRKRANPLCTNCGKRAKSTGKTGAFRCARCGQRFARTAAEMEEIPRALRPGWYEPPVGSRRHLSMPLKRMARRSGPRGASGPARSRVREPEIGAQWPGRRTTTSP
ncbi:MAG TPA: tRNA(Ile)(2)-agmatinylcytidine synthase [Thermoplasmata archaeon]|nr:tRNA(Ile)(2)-agmatinylcytidine synthase [Thermoplasmata archaeon]